MAKVDFRPSRLPPRYSVLALALLMSDLQCVLKGNLQNTEVERTNLPKSSVFRSAQPRLFQGKQLSGHCIAPWTSLKGAQPFITSSFNVPIFFFLLLCHLEVAREE